MRPLPIADYIQFNKVQDKHRSLRLKIQNDPGILKDPGRISAMLEDLDKLIPIVAMMNDKHNCIFCEKLHLNALKKCLESDLEKSI